MTVLVTGGAGYVGSICAEELLSFGARVVVIDNLTTGHRAAIPSGATFVQADFGDQTTVSQVCCDFGVTAVMHFAGATLVERSMTDPQYYFELNIQKGLALVDTILRLKISNFIFSSTAAVYGEPQFTPITEDHPTSPINAYGESKLIFEKILTWYNRAYGLRCAIMRYFNAAGASQCLGEDHRPETHVLPLLLEAVQDPTHKFRLYGSDYPTADGSCIRDFVHVRDIAQAHILALQALPKIGFRIYNVGHGSGYSVRQVVAAVEEVTGCLIPLEIRDRRQGDPAVLLADPSRLRKELNWSPNQSDLKTIVSTAWAWRKLRAAGHFNVKSSGSA